MPERCKNEKYKLDKGDNQMKKQWEAYKVKKISAVLFSVLVAVVLFSSPLVASETIYVMPEGAYLSLPENPIETIYGIDRQVIGSLNPGAELRVVERSDDKIKISIEAWVRADRVTTDLDSVLSVIEEERENLEKQRIESKERLDKERAERALEGVSEADIIAEEDFSYNNISYKDQFGHTEVIGEITNNSGQDFKLALFNVNAYDNNNNLLGVGTASIMNFTARQTKTFTAFVDAPHEDVDTIRIQYEAGY